MKTLDSKKKSRFERVEPGLFRYKPSASYYTVLKKDGKTKWRNLETYDKVAAGAFPGHPGQSSLFCLVCRPLPDAPLSKALAVHERFCERTARHCFLRG